MKRFTVKASLIFALAIAGCGSGGGGTGNCTSATTGAEGKNVANALLLPQVDPNAPARQYGMDLTGDGKMHNQLGNIIGALVAQMLSPQPTVDTAIMTGQVILLLDETASSLTDSDCGQVKAITGKKTAMNPAFDGSDTFTADPAVGTGTFTGKISGGTFNSNSPTTATAQTETSFHLQIPLVGGTPIDLTVHGAHIQFTRSGDKLMSGQINGAIKFTDVQSSIIPAVATTLTMRIATMMGSAMANMMILTLFDTGGSMPDPSCPNGDGTNACKNMTGPDAGMCAKKNDMIISTCEVATNSVIKNLLRSDVQMFAADGTTYMPNPAGTMLDSMSLGIAFTAVKANF